MRIKVFYKDSHFGLENVVNEFIKNKEVIDIKFSVAKANLGYYYTACILYKD